MCTFVSICSMWCVFVYIYAFVCVCMCVCARTCVTVHVSICMVDVSERKCSMSACSSASSITDFPLPSIFHLQACLTGFITSRTHYHSASSLTSAALPGAFIMQVGAPLPQALALKHPLLSSL